MYPGAEVAIDNLAPNLAALLEGYDPADFAENYRKPPPIGIIEHAGRGTANVLADMLSRHGHHVDVAYGGQSALEAIMSGDHDLVISDLRMPGLDGADLHRKLEQMQHPLLHHKILELRMNFCRCSGMLRS